MTNNYNSVLARLFFVIVVAIYCAEQTDGTPTIYAARPFNALSDAKILRKTLNISSIDKKTIIDVLTKRTLLQRLQIVNAYYFRYRQNVVEDLRTKLDGKFGKLAGALFTPPAKFYARELHKALRSREILRGEDIIEILCTQSDSAILEMATAYEHVFGTNLRDALKGTVEKVIYHLCMSRRNENEIVNEELAIAHAEHIFYSGREEGAPTFPVMKFLGTTGPKQLRRTIITYNNRFGGPFADALKRSSLVDNTMGEYVVYRSIECIESKIQCFVTRLYQNLETDERTVIRIIVSRSEIDLGDIKEAYVNRYNETLESKIFKMNVSQDVQDILFSLVSSSNSNGRHISSTEDTSSSSE